MDTPQHKVIPRRRRVSISIPLKERRTKSSFKAECDINNILRKFQKTGAIEHMNKHEPEYGFATSLTFIEAMQTVDQAKQMFADLPSSLRKKFNYKPEAYLDFVQNPENLPEMAELGLLTPEAVSRLNEPPAVPETALPITPDPNTE